MSRFDLSLVSSAPRQKTPLPGWFFPLPICIYMYIYIFIYMRLVNLSPVLLLQVTKSAVLEMRPEGGGHSNPHGSTLSTADRWETEGKRPNLDSHSLTHFIIFSGSFLAAGERGGHSAHRARLLVLFWMNFLVLGR